MSILVTGGAGYIGSHTAAQLLDGGADVLYLDNLSKGYRGAVLNNRLLVGDLRDDYFLDKCFSNNQIEAVVHFAADSLVGESVTDPLKYYNNNLVSTLRLVAKMHRYGVNKLVFSSTAAVYGDPVNIPIVETDPTVPTNPYGESKLAVERMLKWADSAYGIKYAALRYFNAAGAHDNGKIGESHDPETHLIPLILQAASGRREKVMLFGDDYPTDDGTCVRDYIHVTDLAQAHVLALEYLKGGGGSQVFNLGSGKGFSVKQMVETARKVTGVNIKSEMAGRREGDPAVLIASSEKIKNMLGWAPAYDDLETIIATAWRWEQNRKY